MRKAANVAALLFFGHCRGFVGVLLTRAVNGFAFGRPSYDMSQARRVVFTAFDPTSQPIGVDPASIREDYVADPTCENVDAGLSDVCACGIGEHGWNPRRKGSD